MVLSVPHCCLRFEMGTQVNTPPQQMQQPQQPHPNPPNPISFHGSCNVSPRGARGPSPTRRAWSPPPQIMPRVLSPAAQREAPTNLYSPRTLVPQATHHAHLQHSPRQHQRSPVQFQPHALAQSHMQARSPPRPMQPMQAQNHQSPPPTPITHSQPRQIHPIVHAPPPAQAHAKTMPAAPGSHPPASWVPASPRVPEPFQRPASPHLINTQHLPVEYIASPEQMSRGCIWQSATKLRSPFGKHSSNCNLPNDCIFGAMCAMCFWYGDVDLSQALAKVPHARFAGQSHGATWGPAARTSQQL